MPSTDKNPYRLNRELGKIIDVMGEIGAKASHPNIRLFLGGAYFHPFSFMSIFKISNATGKGEKGRL